MKLPIFLDHNSTTPVDPRVLEEMLPWFSDSFGNPASRNHSFGWEAKGAVDEARENCARLIGATSAEIIFTSGATESINLALKGIPRGHIIVSATEHKAVLDTAGRSGHDLTVLPVDSFGRTDPSTVQAALRPDTRLVSIIFANNEIGTINPIAKIGELCREANVLFHTDAAQAVGKLPINVEEMQIDLLSASAHKFYGPKGVGFLFRRHGIELQPLIDGGGHEFGLRSGTLNVPAIVGMSVALKIACGEMDGEARRLTQLRDRLKAMLFGELDRVIENGHPTDRLPGNLNLSFEFAEGEALLMGLTDVALSTGSACTSSSVKPSHVLKAIGLSDDRIHSSLRFGLGRPTTAEEIDYAAERVIEEVRKLRTLSPFYEAVA